MKKTSQNDITGAWLVSKPNNEMFEKNWDLIFGKKDTISAEVEKTIQDHQEIYEAIADIEAHDKNSRIDIVGQNGNDGLHYEYELNKSTGEVEKVNND
jgi:hypothetical protein